MRKRYNSTLTLFSFLFLNLSVFAQTGSIHEPVRYVGGVTIDPSVHEGRLRYAIGTENTQVLRVNRTHPELADDFGWTYNHAPNIAYWNGTFYLEYLSNPIDEHIAPGHTLLVTSKDGRNWEKPKEAFPPYKAPEGVEIPEGYDGYMMHQRMGFYVAPNKRLLLLAFYGHTEHPFNEGGIGRVVREIYKDGTLGPIHFIKYSSYTDFDESNTSYPFYKSSKDKGFVAACDALLSDKLKTLQWRDEDTDQNGFYEVPVEGEEISALSYYHRKDGKVVALWKFSHSALSDDEGKTFSKPVKVPTLLMAGGKNWGQKTDDGRYAMAYNPIEMQEYRFPLITFTSDDGIIYDNMVLVHGEIPARKFFGRWKDFGPCYTRGIVEGNGNPPGDDMWLTYSMNKEDIWVSSVPTPVKYSIEGDVKDDFEKMEVGGKVKDWNIYHPAWAPVEVVKNTSGGKSLQLSDKDPYDYARAIRVFEEGENVNVKYSITPKQNNTGSIEMEVVDRYGNRPVRIILNEKGEILANNGSEFETVMKYEAGKTYEIALDVDATLYGKYSLSINGKEVLKDAQLAEAVKSVERLSFRTGEYRNLPNRKTPNQQKSEPLPGTDESVDEAIFLLDNVAVSTNK
ncbi:MAG: hypothetical protein CMO01_13210 [Thalassobius sp.]|nr:hypothetical protein [Thalassovita sp.]